MHSCEISAWVSLFDMQRSIKAHSWLSWRAVEPCVHLISEARLQSSESTRHAVPEKESGRESQNTHWEHFHNFCGGFVRMTQLFCEERWWGKLKRPAQRLFFCVAFSFKLMWMCCTQWRCAQPVSPIMTIVEVYVGATGGSWHTVHRQIKSPGSEGRNKGSEI